MEKLFTPNKWFVLFCAAFIAVFALLQYVISTRLQTEAKEQADAIYTWVWPDENLRSNARISDARVVKRTDKDAVVEVTGVQTLSPFEDLGKKIAVDEKSGKNQIKAILTFYKMKNEWVLGKVEFD